MLLKAGERYGNSGTQKHNTPYRFDQRRTSLRCIIIKLFKIKDKVRILNSAREKKKERKTLFHTMEFQTAINRFLRQNFANQETVGWYIQSAKWKKKKNKQTACQLRILYLAKVSYKMRENFSRQTEVRELITTRPLVL